MYTSTEPCEMCATAIHYAGLDRVVYSVSGESLSALRGATKSGVSCEELIEHKGGSTDVEGPVLENEGLRPRGVLLGDSDLSNRSRRHHPTDSWRSPQGV